MKQLVAHLNATLDHVEQLAVAAGGRDERPGPPDGEHWHWVRSGHYDPLVDEPVDVFADPGDVEHVAQGAPVSLRSVEEYPTDYVGDLPHFVVNGEETQWGPARHIMRHDPAAVIPWCRGLREVVGWCAEVIGDRDLTGYDDVAGTLAGVPDAMAVTLAVETLRALGRALRLV